MSKRMLQLTLFLGLLVIAVTILLLHLPDKRTPMHTNSFVEELQGYLKSHYLGFISSDDKQGLHNDLVNAANALDTSYVYNDISLEGSYPPNQRWSFFSVNNKKDILGIYCGKKFKIITRLLQKDHQWHITVQAIMLSRLREQKKIGNGDKERGNNNAEDKNPLTLLKYFFPIGHDYYAQSQRSTLELQI